MAGGAREVLDQGTIRRRNLSRMLRAIHTGGPLSRSELAARLCVNRSTVASLVSDLASRGLVRERRPAATTSPGRPSPVVEPRPDGPVVLAAEVATDSLGTAVIGVGGTIIGMTRVDRSRRFADAERTIAELAELARPLLASLAEDQHVVAVGISAPGVVRHEDGFVHVAPNIGWLDVPLARLAAGELALGVPVVVGNDADLAALAEHQRGSGVGTDDFICLWGEAGMGAGIVTGGRPLVGAAGYAGEVGHMAVNGDGLPCRCGSRGCWETEVGEDALLRHAGRGSGDGGRRDLADVFAAADKGSQPALAAIQAVGAWLGLGIAGLVDVFNPSRVALGGLYARLLPYTREVIEDQLDRRSMTAARALVEVVPVGLGADATILGAAELALAPLLDDPTIVPVRHRSADSGGPGPWTASAASDSHH
jgi:predicted NBD/HSP70 family sugar kinase